MNFSCRYLLLVIIVLALFPANAVASPGQWAPSDLNFPVFDSDRRIFNDQGLEQQSSFACLTADGQQLSAASSEELSRILLAASDVYNGQFSFAQASDLDRAERPPKNGGYQSGKSGMQAFLRQEKALLQSGQWIAYDLRTMQREKERRSYPSGAPGWYVVLTADGQALSTTQSQQIAGLLNTEAANPLQLTADLPPACAVSPLDPSSPQFGQLFSNSGDFLTEMVLYGPAKLASAAYDFLQPYAFKYTFYTPHTELGDLFWSAPESCPPGQECAVSSGLGYQQAADSSGSGRPWFLAAAQLTQWLVSGAFFLVLFASAALFIVRGNRASNLRIMELLPRLFLSILLTIFAGAIIGALITFSNLLVNTIFEFSGAAVIGNINTFLLQAGSVVGGPKIFQDLTSLIVGVLTVFFFLVFVVFSLARQLALVAGIILAPLAAFSFIVPRWAGSLKIYLRAMSAAIFMPVVLAFILAVGMSINPLAQNPEGAYGQLQGALGLILMIVTLWLMYRAIRLTKEFIVNGQIIPSVAGDKRSVREIIGEQIRDAGQKAGQLIPGGREAGATAASEQKRLPRFSDPDPGEGGGSSRRAAPEGRLALLGPVESQQGAGGGGAGPGIKISKGQARSYRDGLNKAIGAKQANLNRPLRPEEVNQLKAAYAAKNGGELREQNGHWFLVPAAPPSYQGRSE